ncbi:MAG: lipid IV(A) 3-deoxy-D-manno-octulosonic acid transferase, partial [Acidihalobacter sp.]
MRILYSLLLYLLTPLVIARLYWRGRANPDYHRRIAERFAHYPRLPNVPRIWVHAVSVGEVIASTPLIRRLQSEFPGHRILVTTTTPTGSAQVRRLFHDSVDHCYLPYDLPHVVRRFLRKTRPLIAVIMETELWPNLFAACARRDIPLMIANARLSERSARGYARFASLTRRTLWHISHIAAQGKQDAQRFLELGAPSERVQQAGNIKFDISVPEEQVAQGQALREGLGSRPVWIAASTHAGEDDILLDAHHRLLEKLPDAFLILVPRHPERFDEVAALCREQGLRSMRRSTGAACAPDTQVLVGDTLGELLALYAAADAAFVGGSLIPIGGHNPLEPAALGLPVLTGPHIFNFNEVYARLFQAGAAVHADDAVAIAAWLEDLLTDDDKRRHIGESGRQVVES